MSDIIDEFPKQSVPVVAEPEVLLPETITDIEGDGTGLDREQRRLLTLTQTAREKIITKLMGDKLDMVPESTRDQMLLVQALDGTDRQVLQRARLKSDNKAANNMAALAAELLKQVNVNTPPPLPAETQARKAPSIPTELEDIKLVPGETDIGEHGLTYETFMQGEIKPKTRGKLPN